MAPSDLVPMGSIADISARLLLWSKQAVQGLARVEFSSEFSRQQVLTLLRAGLEQERIPFAEVQLPTYAEPMEVVDDLLAQLDRQASGVVSIHGFSTAFRAGIPLEEAMYALNFNRERFAERPLRQIWWMTPAFYDAAQFAMPDLMSWFNPRLRLTEAVVVEPQDLMVAESTTNIDDVRQRVAYLIQRFEQGQRAGASAADLLKFNLLPALEALAEVKAQKELQDLTSQFEGFLSQIPALDSPDLATSLERLGQLYQTQGRYGEAEPLLQKALKSRFKLCGEDHLDYAASLNNLAELYRVQGRYSEAESLYARSLKIAERQLGVDHHNVAKSLNNLATLYTFQGRYSEAESLYIRSLGIRERQLGGDHSDVANSLNNLAALYTSQGRYNEAELLYRQSLKISERQLGEDHPAVATSLNNLGKLYDSQGHYREAESLYERSLKIMENSLGIAHPDTITTRSNLASVLRKMSGQ